MYLYLALSLIPIVMSWLIKNKTLDKQRKIYLFSVFGILAFFTCFRGSTVGTDTAEYLKTFQLVKMYGYSGFGLDHALEYGYFFIVQLFTQLFSSGQSIIVFFTGLTYAIIAYAIYKHSEDVVMSSFLFVVWILPSTMNGMRQHFAFALILLAFIKMCEQKNLQSVLLIIIAVTFHNSAVIFLPFLLVYSVMKRWSGYKGVMILCLAAFVSLVFVDRIIQLISRFIPRYAHYLVSSYYDKVESSNAIWLIIYVVFLFCYLSIVRNKTKRDEFGLSNTENANVYYMLLLVLHIAVLVLEATVRGIFSRLTVYTSYGAVFIIPYVMRNFFTYSPIRLNKRDKGIVIALFYMLFIVWDYLMLRQNPHHIIPYAFSFFN